MDVTRRVIERNLPIRWQAAFVGDPMARAAAGCQRPDRPLLRSPYLGLARGHALCPPRDSTPFSGRQCLPGRDGDSIITSTRQEGKGKPVRRGCLWLLGRAVPGLRDVGACCVRRATARCSATCSGPGPGTTRQPPDRAGLMACRGSWATCPSSGNHPHDKRGERESDTQIKRQRVRI